MAYTGQGGRGGYRSQVISCTTEFKYDAQKPWVTSVNPIQIRFFFNPNMGITLEDVATTIDNFASAQFRSNGQVESFNIRGQLYSRESMANFKASDNLYDGESFNLVYKHNIGICCAIL